MKSRPRSAWDLPELVYRPLPVRRNPAPRRLQLRPHHAAIVEYVYTTRYATSAQVQRRFPQWFRSQRTVQYQMAGLVQAGYLAITPVRGTSPNFPLVFRATGRGINLVRDAYAQQGIRWSAPKTEESRTAGAGSESILHELLLSELMLAVGATIGARGDLNCPFVERRYFRRELSLSYAAGGRTRRVIPDTGFMVQVAGGPAILNFVELDNGSESVARLADKYRSYERWAAADEGAEYLAKTFGRHGAGKQRPDFRLLMIAHASDPHMADERRLLDLILPVLDCSRDMRDRVWLTTAAQLREHHDEASPLDAPIWLRARDARRWLARYQSHAAALHGTAAEQLKSRRQYVADQLKTMPRHPLFPYPKANAARGKADGEPPASFT